MKTRLVFGIILTCAMWSGLRAQTFYTPIRGITATSFSSAFGPRDVGSDEYPNSGYDYDFHAAIDIASSNGTNVYRSGEYARRKCRIEVDMYRTFF